MDTLVIIGTIIGIFAAIVGTAAAVVQVREYLEKRKEKAKKPHAVEGRPAPPSPPRIPHNLPARTILVGRTAEKARAHEALRSPSSLISVDGIGGIGKTALALEVAHECLHSSEAGDSAGPVATFAGFIWTTARDRQLTLNDLLDATAWTLGYPGIVQKPVAEKQMAVRQLLQERPYLLIVDNLETIADEKVFAFLLALPEPTKALITTREKAFVDRAATLSLKPLEQVEAMALLRTEGHRLDLSSIEQAKDEVLLPLHEAAKGVPLAIKWAVGQIKQRGQSLDTVLSALHEARGDVFEAVFARSWALLSSNAQGVLMVMPIFATSASKAGIGAASDVHDLALDEALGQLVEMSLVDASDELDLARRRYSIHPLTRAFAMAKLQPETETHHAAFKRLAEFMRSLTATHGGFWYQDGFAQLETERENILATIQGCWDQGLTDTGKAILHESLGFLVVRGYWNDVLELTQRAAEQAAATGDGVWAALWRTYGVSWVYRHRGDLDAAERLDREALEVFEQHGARALDALFYTKRSLGRVAQERGQFEQAEALFNEVLQYYKSTGDERDILFVTNSIAQTALQRGDLDRAQAISEGALEPAHRVGELQLIGSLHSILGGVAIQRGEFEQAKRHWEEALACYERIERLDERAGVLLALARVELEGGSTNNAKKMLSRALDDYRRLGVQPKVQEIESLLADLAEPAYHEEDRS